MQDPNAILTLHSGFSLRILLAGEKCNVTGDYSERGSMSESKIVIEYEILAREFCIVSGEFSDLWCLMNTLYTKLTLRKKPTVLQTRQLSIIVNTPVWE